MNAIIDNGGASQFDVFTGESAIVNSVVFSMAKRACLGMRSKVKEGGSGASACGRHGRRRCWCYGWRAPWLRCGRLWGCGLIQVSYGRGAGSVLRFGNAKHSFREALCALREQDSVALFPHREIVKSPNHILQLLVITLVVLELYCFRFDARQ